ncbi:MAG: DUF4091 domain-containing protein [Clostridia bacterium]|nr:DUF4091 domain-containing protein [Clostridia bacterium]
MILTRIVSSVEKCFLDEQITDFAELKAVSMLANERLSVQLLHTADAETANFKTRCILTFGGALAPYARARSVEQVPVLTPTYPDTGDDNYLRRAPGLYPDVLQPLQYGGSLLAAKGLLQSVWIEIDPRGALPDGTYPLTYTLTSEAGEELASGGVEIEVIGARLPDGDMIFTQWFHCDCLANYYGCEVWSEKHWEIVENFARTASANGINMLLTPIHTPPLDTAIGGERTTNQLVDVTLTNGEYSFGFEKLDRWIDMCDRVGIKYFEIAHFFTQWGAKHAPKIMACVDGEYKRIFGWETDATGEDYVRYLNAFIPAFLSHMKARGDDKRCYFHVSDEPNAEQLPAYRAAKAVVAELLDGYVIMDALSNFEFWSQGVVETPVPASNHIEPFIEAQVPGLWTYYCCSQHKDVSNRFIAMPLWRTRCIGMQFYKYDIVGFLHWGYNHYNNWLSVDPTNPYLNTDGSFWVPAGDAFSVYPAQDGTALESIRLLSFYEGLQDARAMRLAAEYCGKDAVIAAMEKIFGEEIRFDRCVRDGATMLAIRACVNDMIKQAIAK